MNISEGGVKSTKNETKNTKTHNEGLWSIRKTLTLAPRLQRVLLVLDVFGIQIFFFL
jgi:hypothetical protein